MPAAACPGSFAILGKFRAQHGALPRMEMVRLEGETSNRLFEILADWNEILKSTSLAEKSNDNPLKADTRPVRKRS
ncbi:hypothetical protein [Citromicrobium sp. WPS32]|uniref:hypothetical protein n=1 Tax=Citromicrobium sp. WPS32 TaxID=1634517 RepID=UPI0012E217B6|nr:hypothetical protein [Citromicrobium sp. WPS32]